jgi:hypothetical protein
MSETASERPRIMEPTSPSEAPYQESIGEHGLILSEWR